MTTDSDRILSQSIIQKIGVEAAKYPSRRAAVKSALRYAQAEHGWINEAVVGAVAEVLNLERIEVFEVATFYDMFYTRPVGRFPVRVCTNISCLLMGSDDIVNHIEKKLDIKTGESTADGKFYIKREEECLAACCGAPMMQVDHRYYENLTIEKIDQIIGDLDNER